MTSAIKEIWRFSNPPVVVKILITASRQWKENLPTTWSSNSWMPKVAAAAGKYLNYIRMQTDGNNVKQNSDKLSMISLSE